MRPVTLPPSASCTATRCSGPTCFAASGPRAAACRFARRLASGPGTQNVAAFVAGPVSVAVVAELDCEPACRHEHHVPATDLPVSRRKLAVTEILSRLSPQPAHEAPISSEQYARDVRTRRVSGIQKI